MTMPRHLLLTLALVWSLVSPLAALAVDRDGVDVEALARIRPGTPISALRAAVGRHWREPKRERDLEFDPILRSHGFRALFFTDRVSVVEYLEGFDETVSIDGVRIGMSLEEMKAARPDLRFSRTDGLPEDHAWTGLPTGGHMVIGFEFDRVSSVYFAEHDPLYRPEPSYLAAAGIPGAPFKDSNLKLLVLQYLEDKRRLYLGLDHELAEHVLKRTVLTWKEGPLPAVYDYLARYPLTDKQLAPIKTLKLGRRAIFWKAFPNVDIERGLYEVKTFKGIEHFPRLENLEFTFNLTPVDLRELLVLPRLKRLRLEAPVSNLDALLRMTQLTEFMIVDKGLFNDIQVPGHPSRTVIDTLKARGVHVSVRNATW
jgi:hypothetical protein